MYDTPVARRVSGSTSTLCTIAPVTSVQRPVARASAIVVNDALKYECVTQPCSQGPQKWHAWRPLIERDRFAVRPWVSVRPNAFLKRVRSATSAHVIAIGGWNRPSGRPGRPSVMPCTPMYCSTRS